MNGQQHAIDLTRHHFVRHIGDLSLYGSWIFNNDQEAEEPALVVIPRYRTSGFKPCVVALSVAHKYNNPRYAVIRAGEFANVLGFEISLSTVTKIASLIHDHLLDLLKMPPSPTTAIIVGEAVINDGDFKRTIELLDYEPTRQV